MKEHSTQAHTHTQSETGSQRHNWQEPQAKFRAETEAEATRYLKVIVSNRRTMAYLDIKMSLQDSKLRSLGPSSGPSF